MSAPVAGPAAGGPAERRAVCGLRERCAAGVECCYVWGVERFVSVWVRVWEPRALHTCCPNASSVPICAVPGCNIAPNARCSLLRPTVLAQPFFRAMNDSTPACLSRDE
eukprot:366537-Chlamydomonas_euryale.AAC.5